MKIPFVDLHAQYVAHRADIDRAIQQVIEETAFIGGKPVLAFEEAFARDYGVRHCVSCANGTDAIYIALRMMGIGPGDEVITTAHSWISTSEAVTQAGAVPVFVDVDEFYGLDLAQVEQAITPRTRAVIPVHLYGQSIDMGTLSSLCTKRGLLLLEDCAQAHYASWQGRRVGTFGAAGTFSFYPGKNLGAYGDAGCILTDDDALAQKMRTYANHGQLRKHDHRVEGINSRLDGLQAAILSAKLPHIHEWTRARQRVAGWYAERLSGVSGVELPRLRSGASHVYHLYVIQVDDREGLAAHLAQRGVQTAVHYPTALPMLPAYADRGFKASAFPRAVANQQRILSLPIYPEMTQDMVAWVADGIAEFQTASRRTKESAS